MRFAPFPSAFSIAAALALAGCNAAMPSAIPAGSSPNGPAVLRAAASTLTVSPKTLNFTTTPTMKLTIAEKGYKGKFKIAVVPSGIVKFSSTSPKGPGPVKVTVTAVNAGKATITVSDATGGKKNVPTTVTQGVIIIQ